MAARRGPTYLRVALGKELRTLRDQLGLTAEAVSLELGFSRSKVSRVESGDIPLPKLNDLERLLDRYGVDDIDARDALLQMQRGSLSKEPFTSYTSLLPSGMPIYLGLERDATRIRGNENHVVHGLLQDESYATALAHSAKVVEERTTSFVEQGVRLRMERKQLLTQSDGPEVHIILTESALRTVIGSPEVMRAQYAEIKRLCALEKVEVQIIPEDLPTYRSGWNFTVLEFTGLGPVTQSDSAKATTMWSKESDVGQFQRQFVAMAMAAPGPSQTPQILDDLEKRLWK
ncbi:helix-turn-helix domain-containing protein [Streptomyces jumonjinensis]|uniref:Helix-turn-helix domain-containing protein n=1 Tax=Streptomyces jumonjinensis TaxID=1945 RepID=A0A646KSL3_STRJU|nr:helix-turn-helix transcriptional regulator [Streptomyces jumonjinensis]MQT05078.1 helix-turn-helix domain-containing protein [Streptomyces jumonjinensis]